MVNFTSRMLDGWCDGSIIRSTTLEGSRCQLTADSLA